MIDGNLRVEGVMHFSEYFQNLRLQGLWIGYSSHCQIAPLYRPEKPAQFCSELAQFERILEIAAYVLDMIDFFQMSKKFGCVVL